MDSNELKAQALLESISNIVTNYENKVADLRIELTLLTSELQELRNRTEKDSDENIQE